MPAKKFITASASEGRRQTGCARPRSFKTATSPPAAGVTPPNKAVPISVFVIRKLNRLFVRQRFRPLFDVPITIENPGEPLGTHVLTLLNRRMRQSRFAGTSFPAEDIFRRATSLNKKPNATIQGIAGAAPTSHQADDANAALSAARSRC
jgi:hypothetical protein